MNDPVCEWKNKPVSPFLFCLTATGCEASGAAQPPKQTRPSLHGDKNQFGKVSFPPQESLSLRVLWLSSQEKQNRPGTFWGSLSLIQGSSLLGFAGKAGNGLHPGTDHPPLPVAVIVGPPQRLTECPISVPLSHTWALRSWHQVGAGTERSRSRQGRRAL